MEQRQFFSPHILKKKQSRALAGLVLVYALFICCSNTRTSRFFWVNIDTAAPVKSGMFPHITQSANHCAIIKHPKVCPGRSLLPRFYLKANSIAGMVGNHPRIHAFLLMPVQGDSSQQKRAVEFFRDFSLFPLAVLPLDMCFKWLKCLLRENKISALLPCVRASR